MSNEISQDGIPAQQAEATKVPVTTPAQTPQVQTTTAVETKPAETPVVTTTEVKSDSKEASIDFNDFELAKAGVQAQPKAVESKPKDEKQVQQKPEDKKIEDKGSAKTQEVKTPEELEEAKRDYSIFDEKDLPVIKRLKNDHFNFVKDKAVENKQIKDSLATTQAELKKLKDGGLPDNYYEHERGFVLSPEFEKVASNVNIAGQVLNFWESQFESVRKGETNSFHKLLQKHDGTFYKSDPIQVTKESEAELANFVSFARNQQAKFNAQLELFQQNHTNITRNAVQALRDHETRSFVQFKDVDAAKLTPILQKVIDDNIPVQFRASPLAQFTAKALITIEQMGTIIKDLQSKVNGGITTATVKTEDGKIINLADQQKAGPTTASLSGGGNSKKDSDVSFDDFVKAKA